MGIKEQKKSIFRDLLHLLRGVAIVAAVMMLCSSATFFGLDRICLSELSESLPIYPGAEVRSERHSFITSFGLGETIVMLYTPDDVQTVTTWYGRNSGTAARARAQNGVRRLSDGRFNVANDISGTGSQIILHGVCGG